jgi:hypothetical protein
MVVFVDLEDESEPPELSNWSRLSLNLHGGLMNRPLELQEKEVDKGRVNPNKNSITEALGCYP